MERRKIILAIQDLIIAYRNLRENLPNLEGKNLQEMERICNEILNSIANMIELNTISKEEIDFDN